MGNTIGKVLADVDNQPENKKEAQDALNSLQVMGKDKATIHYQSVVSDAMDAKLLPVHKVITKMQMIQCGVSKNPDTLKQNIKSSISNFVKGEIVYQPQYSNAMPLKSL